MRDFDYPDICWKGSVAIYETSRRFLKNVEDNFLMQVIDEPVVEYALSQVKNVPL